MGKGLAIKKKNTEELQSMKKINFFVTFLLSFKYKKYFTLNISTYISFKSLSVGIFTGLLQYLPKKTAPLVQRLRGEKKC